MTKLSRATGQVNKEYADKTAVDFLRHYAKETPDAPAIVHLSDTVTYSQFDEQTDNIAAALIAAGIKPGDCVGVSVRRTELLPLCIYGIFKAGAAYSPLDPNYPAKRLLYMANDAAMKVILTEPVFFDKYAGSESKILDAQELRAADGRLSLLPSVTPDMQAAVVYTSGSTGTPKGVIIRHHNIMNIAMVQKNVHNITAADAVSAYASIAFVATFIEYFPPVVAGAVLHILDDSIRLDPRAENDYFEKHNIAVAFLPSAAAPRFLSQIENHSLRSVYIGGERFIPYESSKSSFKVFNIYGSTEVSSYYTTIEIPPGEKHITVGTAVDNMEVYIVNTQNEIVPIGETGEICAAGFQVGYGYNNLPEKTAAAFTANPFNSDPDYARLYHSGDVGRMDENGNIEVRGRLDYQVKVRGFRIELGEIDTVALQCPGIEEAVTIAVEGPDGENKLVTYISPPNSDTKALKKFIGEHLPEYMVPAIVMTLDKLPRNFSNKIDRAALPAPIIGVPQGSQLTAAETPAEKQLAAALAKVLKIPEDSIGVDSDIFDLGLDSLLVFDFILEIQQRSGIDVAIDTIKQNPALRQLAAVIGTETNFSRSGQKPAVSAYPIQEYYPLTEQQLLFVNSYNSDPEDVGNNVSLFFTFAAETNIEKLRKALSDTFLAHPILSATFVNSRKKYFCKRNLDPKIAVETAELTDAQFEEEKLSFPQPFHLFTDERLYRLKICKTPSAVYLLFEVHHTLFDGTSQTIILDELARAYSGENLIVEKKTFFEEALDAHTPQALAKLHSNSNLIAKRMQEYGGATQVPLEHQREYVPLTVHKAFTEESPQLRKLCKQESISAEAVFSAAIGAVLSELSGKDKIVFAGGTTGRTRAAQMKIVGPFARGKMLFLDLHTKQSKWEQCRQAEKEIAAAAALGEFDIMKAFMPHIWSIFTAKLPLVFLFHSTLLDPDKMPKIEGKNIVLDFIPKERVSKTPKPQLHFFVSDNSGVFFAAISGNGKVTTEKYLKSFGDKIAVYIGELLAEHGANTYPLTLTQQECVNSSVKHNGCIADNISFCFDFSAKADTSKLFNALKTVIAAHPLLSAHIIKFDSEYRWVNERETASSALAADIVDVTDEQFSAEEQRFVRPFRLTEDTCYCRAKLFRTPSAVKMLFDVNHSVFDGVSLKVFLNEIAAAYNGEPVACEGTAALEAGELERRQLAAISEPAPPVQRILEYIGKNGYTAAAPRRAGTGCGGTAAFISSKPYNADVIKRFCSNNNLSPNSIFAGTFASALFQPQDAAFVLLASGRDADNAKSVGGYIKTLPIVIRYDASASPLEKCLSAKREISEVLHYSDALSKYQPHCDTARNALYIFHGDLLDNAARPLLEGEPAAVRFIGNNNNTPKFALECIAGENEGYYTITCKYNTALIDAPFAKQFIGKLENGIDTLLAAQAASV